MHRHTRPAAGVLMLLLLFGLAIGCRQEVPPLFRRNQPPETTLTVIPEDSAFGFYRYHVYWRGEDSDGRVVRYIFAITDTLSRDEEQNWDPERFEDRERSSYTDKSDSIFIFDSARGRQAFNISAIDDFGRSDPSPARAFFRIADNGLPKVKFLDVQGFRDDGDLPVCIGQACTIPTFTNFKIRFTGTTPNGHITGFQWQRVPPAPREAGPFEPAGVDSLYLAAGRDTTGFSFAGDTLWTLRGDIVTVYQYNADPDSTIRSGNFKLRARVRDDARRESLFSSGELLVVLNYDPDTRLDRIAARDCPRCSLPNPPPYCSGNDSLAVGWVAGYDRTAIVDSTLWERFCDGDTLPNLAHVRFFARGRDDGRDLPNNGTALGDVRFSARFEWTAGEGQYEIHNGSMPFSVDTLAVAGNYHAPDGRPWHGWVNGWGDPEFFPGTCPFNFTYFVSAVDENDKRDGTPDSLSFFVSGSPTLDSLHVPLVVVLAPRCPPLLPQLCPNTDSLAFGPDTLLVVGHHVPDPDPAHPQTPLALGFNRFFLPFPAWGHDWPRDSNPLIREEFWGRIRSWLFGYQCQDASCGDLPPLSGQGQWRNDRPEPNVFDDSLQVYLVLDTLCLAQPCVNLKVALPEGNFGPFRFSIQGRDTSALEGSCNEPSDLGRNPATFNRPTSDYGRTTASETRQIVMRQLQDVRPYAKSRGLGKPARAPIPMSRQGWWRR